MCYNYDMHKPVNKNLQKRVTFLIAALFVFASIFTVSLGMKTDDHGNMSACLFMAGQAAICPMGITEHILKWKQMFTATIKLKLNVALQLFTVFFISLILATRFFQKQARAAPKHSLRLVRQQRLEGKIHYHLHEAFSDGILNPKIY